MGADRCRIVLRLVACLVLAAVGNGEIAKMECLATPNAACEEKGSPLASAALLQVKAKKVAMTWHVAVDDEQAEEEAGEEADEAGEEVGLPEEELDEEDEEGEEVDDADQNEEMLGDDITVEDNEEEDEDASLDQESVLLAHTASTDQEGLSEERGGKGKKKRRKGGKGGKKPTPKPADNQDKPLNGDANEPGGGSESSPPSCELEKKIYETMSKMFVHLPTALRFLFHDSTDENNLMWNSGNAWKPVKSKERYGGIDLCLYSPLEHGKPKPGHNRNLAVPYYGKQVCKKLCARVGRNSICSRGEDACAVDLTVMGSLTALAKVGVTKTTMTWGRRKGDCSNVIETPFTKNKREIAAYKDKLALGFAPSMTGMDSPDIFHDVFKKMGFSPVDYAALMGAHSMGKVRPCADGLNGVEVGPWCGDVKKMDPALDNSNMVPWNKGSLGAGTCNPKPWIRGNCWQQKPTKPVYAYHHTGRVADWRNNEARKMKAAGVKPSEYKNTSSDAWKKVKWTKIFKKQFGDGGFWDRTPQVFDNDYYKLFVNETFDGKDVCCGSIKNGFCHRTGTMAVITKRSHSGKASMSGGRKSTSPCAVSWCRDDRKGRQHMKSTKTWHEPLHAFAKKGHHHGVTMRMVRLPGDWALLSKKETTDAVLRFAEDQDAFFEAFGDAWNKVTQKGYGGSLQTCVERPSNKFENAMISALGPKKRRRKRR